MGPCVVGRCGWPYSGVFHKRAVRSNAGGGLWCRRGSGGPVAHALQKVWWWVPDATSDRAVESMEGVIPPRLLKHPGGRRPGGRGAAGSVVRANVPNERWGPRLCVEHRTTGAATESGNVHGGGSAPSAGLPGTECLPHPRRCIPRSADGIPGGVHVLSRGQTTQVWCGRAGEWRNE